MKTKYLLVGTLILLVAGGLWAGRVAWQVRRQRVTLDIRNMPLPEVLRRIEWQTWKKIRAEQSLDARITLHVKDKPLNEVLDRIAEQAGARWSTVYAVYQSPTACKALEGALTGDGKLESAGWSRVAPQVPGFGSPAPQGGDAAFHSNANSAQSGPALAPEPSVGDGPPAMGGGAGMMTFRRSPGGMMVSRNANGQTEMWSPTELVVETVLQPQLGTGEPTAPTAQMAQEAARKVKAKWTTYLSFRKSIMGIGFTGPGRAGGPLKHARNDRFARLTPEQRVEQARERGKFRRVFPGQ